MTDFTLGGIPKIIVAADFDGVKSPEGKQFKKIIFRIHLLLISARRIKNTVVNHCPRPGVSIRVAHQA